MSEIKDSCSFVDGSQLLSFGPVKYSVTDSFEESQAQDPYQRYLHLYKNQDVKLIKYSLLEEENLESPQGLVSLIPMNLDNH